MNRRASRPFKLRSQRTRRRRPHRGVAAVEFALTAPLVFLLLMGAVEFGRANMIRHTVDNAAYEGARAGITPGATAADVQAAVDQVLAVVKANGATVTITPAAFSSSTPELTVEVSVPYATNGYVSATFMKGKSLIGRVTLTREVTES